MQYITLIDYILLPLYLGIFFFFAKKMAKHYKEPDLKKYLLTAFWLRMFGCIAYSMIVQYYYGYGDSFTYFAGSNFFTDQFAKDPSTIKYLFSSIKETSYWYDMTSGDKYFSGYFGAASGNMVMKISAVLSYLSFNRFLIISLFFGFFSFAGQWKLFLVFDDINKNRYRKLLAFATLYSPSIWFWGSGLMKDSLCIGATGFVIHFLYTLLIKKKFSIWGLIYSLIFLYAISVIKSYITAILFVSMAVMLLFIFLKKVKHIVLKLGIIMLLMVVTATVLANLDLSSQITEIAEESVLQIQSFQQNYQASQEAEEMSKGGYEIGELNPSLTSIVLKSPLVIFTCLYRPFMWESGKIMIFFTSLESTLLLLCTLYLFKKTKVIGFFKIIFTNQYMLFCFVLSMLFALTIGFTTFNFGTMVRYKIIFLPFFYFMLVYIYSEMIKNKAGEPVNGIEKKQN